MQGADHSFIPLKLIKKCYYSKDKDEIRSLKIKINKRVKKILPAIRLYMDRLCKKHTGKYLDECFEKDRVQEVLEKKGLLTILNETGNLIKNDKEIEEVYHYPPLTEKAKRYYSQSSLWIVRYY